MQIVLNGKWRSFAPLPQLLRIMKLTIILLTVAALHVSAKSYSQRVTLSLKDAPLEQVFREIQKQTGIGFFFTRQMLENTKPVTIQVKDTPMDDALKLCFKNQPLTFNMVNNNIVISEKKTIPNVESGNENLPVTIDVHGRIVNENGEGVIATVAVKGTSNATSTDNDGYFTLKGADENATLIITASNIETREVRVNGKSELASLSVKMKVSPLDEMQVIAYGQTSRRLNTGNVSTVKSDDIQKQPVNNPLLALQGRVPGLFINQNTGIPGGGITIRLEGQNSLSRGSDPLYVIDGVPYISQLLPNLSSSGTGGILGNSNGNTNTTIAPGGGNPLAFINSADIESIDILKDADATAIYGSRAANGAILITTKKGKAGKTKVDLNIQSGWGKVTRKLDLLNTQQYLAMRRQAYYNDSVANPTGFVSPTMATAPDLLYWDANRNTDWQKVLLGGTAKYNDIQFSVSGGTANTQFLIGTGYHRETTVFPGDLADQKGSFHLNINHLSANQRFKIVADAKYLVDDNHLITTDLTNYALKLPPNAPDLYNADGTINWAPLPNGNSTWVNPLSFFQKEYDFKNTNLIANSVLSYQLVKGLEIKSNFGYFNLQTNEVFVNPLTSYSPETRPSGLRLGYFGNGNINTWNIEPQISYKLPIGKGNLETLAGATILQTTSNDLIQYGYGYNSDLVIRDILSATNLGIVSTVNSQYKYAALFARLNYNLNNKYILNFTGRRDGSSRFGLANQFHNFGSAAGAWLFSNESFIQKHLPVVSFGKLRVSYGTTGNDQIGDYQYLSLYSPVSVSTAYQGASGLAPSGLPNPNLQWEETKKLQFGADIGLIKDRILVNVNYYHNRSSNLLQSYVLPILTGNSGIQVNFPALVQNSGWELALNTRNFDRKNFTWSTNINLTIPRNKLVDFPNLATSTYASVYVVGQPITIRKAYNLVGVDPATGLFQFMTSTGTTTSGNLVTADRTILENIDPKFYGGFQNSFTYKNFQLDVLFQFVKQLAPNYVLGARPGVFNFNFSTFSLTGNQPTYVLSNWQKAGDQASIQRYSATYPATVSTPYSNAGTSNALYSDGSYIRLKNLSLSWSVPEKLRQKAHLQNARVYVQGQNLFTITNYKGLDPETPSAGVLSLPPLTVVTIGLQIGL